MNYSLRHINAYISVGGRGSPWMFTGFYGNPDQTQRETSWKLLTHLSSLIPSEWLCIGDFNEIVAQSEKVGGRTRSETQMENFRAALRECELQDLGYKGPRLTWRNKRESDALSKNVWIGLWQMKNGAISF